MAEYHNQSKLRFWCQMVLPLVYDDSLSYMELLNKVVSYLNNCIQDVGNCETNIESLLEAFVNLQDYVNEIAEDITPIIEEKIDEMIESGEFGEILADALATVVAPEYDSSESYVPLNYAIYDGALYCCTGNTTGEWDSTKWRETTVGDELNTLMQKVYSLNAGDVSFNASTNYPSGTVGNKLKSLTANDIEYNSSETYNDATVGKELRNLNGAITSMNHSITSWDVKTNGKILFLSNSYGNLSSQNWQKFPYWCATYLGLGAEGTNWWNCAQPYFSLAHPDSTKSFKKELQDWVSAHASEKANIGAVVVVGGINDSRPTESGEPYARYTKVLEKFEDLISYIKTNLPNATAYCGFTGWIDPIVRPADVRRGVYRLKVAQSYMEATQYGWKYLNGIENIIHNKNYLADGIHPNEAGAKRLGLALAEALSTGNCEIIEWSTTIPTALEGGSIGGNAKARERQQNGIINTQFNAFQFVFASNTTVNVGDLLVVGNINLNMSTGVVEFGNQTITLASYASSTWTEHGTLARVFIADNGDVTLQIKAFFDGSTSKTVRRVTSFIISESHAVYADDTWNNTIDDL